MNHSLVPLYGQLERSGLQTKTVLTQLNEELFHICDYNIYQKKLRDEFLIVTIPLLLLISGLRFRFEHYKFNF